MDKKYICTICNKPISKNQKARHEKTETHKLKKVMGGDLHTMSSKLPNFPWSKYDGEHHLPGKNYAGPGTRLDIRLDENNIPKPGEEPVDKVDVACLKHDIEYKNHDIRSRQKADIDLIQDINDIKSPTLRERIDRLLIKNAMKLKIALGGEIVPEEQRNQLASDLATELHKEYRKPKLFLKVKVFNKDDIWGADLVEMQNSKNNKDYRYILTIIDLYTKYAWAIPLKDKKGITVRDAFEELFEKDPTRIPKHLYVDHGSEFYNKYMKELLDNNEIKIYSTYNQPDERNQGPSHNPVIERFNRTLKNIMFKKFTERGNRIWHDMLPELVKIYNNKKHRTIQTTPVEASKHPESIRDIVDDNNNENVKSNEKIKFHIGDRVRIFKWKTRFEKGYTYKWSKEIFQIDKVYDTQPITYHIKDLQDEDVLGRFYANELQRSSF